ncbi:adenosylcobinamide amidohydrolase [Crossiella cryophila]|uniref:Adenosylcobinamide amidohydrolase n=1 Tax=Crossiella cryophila TaxID=43355 RepID=A0A7W7C780_9PSEU|nr:adenosylcobinamide amidohydrolase [Crossiella cryophila]MBB4675761.1 adenosylcobinamide amidohydrolase [Crossiella cryophila]
MTPETEWLDGFPVLAWQLDRPWLAISSAVLGGGLGERDWVLNATVPTGYDRTDPEVHCAQMAERIGLSGNGTALLTAVDVRHAVLSEGAGVSVTATTGVGQPLWAASAEPPVWLPPPGTINVVGWLPVRLTEGALVNAVATVAEAKAQALVQAGIEGTGTCTDATVLLCPADGHAERYGGPRSLIGSALAQAVHTAISTGLRLTAGEARFGS